jgi:putative NIF3 family GTP cyclohydrolase 1 type 2
MEDNIYKRRDFLENMVKAGALGIVGTPVLQPFNLAENLTVNQIIEKILSELPGARQNETVDTLKRGSGDQVVTGIVTTMFATVQVIREAIKIKANFIIAHEPTYYNHLDDTRWVENNIVVFEKKELLAKNRITVWRFHDYWHRMKPDGIRQGFLLKAGWSVYNPNADVNFRIPAQKMDDIINQLKEKLHIPHIRFIGDKSATCSNICLVPGAGGGKLQLSSAIAGNADLIIVGESSEWETPEYVRDARAFGHSLSMIILGHAFSEDPGMDYLAGWLQPKIPGMPVNHIASGEPFGWA